MNVGGYVAGRLRINSANTTVTSRIVRVVGGELSC